MFSPIVHIASRNVEDYIALRSEPTRKALEKVHKAICDAACCEDEATFAGLTPSQSTTFSTLISSPAPKARGTIRLPKIKL